MVYIASDGQVINIYQRSTIYQGTAVRNPNLNNVSLNNILTVL